MQTLTGSFEQVTDVFCSRVAMLTYAHCARKQNQHESS